MATASTPTTEVETANCLTVLTCTFRDDARVVLGDVDERWVSIEDNRYRYTKADTLRFDLPRPPRNALRALRRTPAGRGLLLKHFGIDIDDPDVAEADSTSGIKTVAESELTPAFTVATDE